MTQARFNYAGRYFRFVFGRIKACLVFSILFSIGFLPPLCIVHDGVDRATHAVLSSISLISVFGLIVVAFVTPLIAMKHLYTKTTADNILSLPLTAAQRYFCELGAVLLCLGVPFAVISFPFAAVMVPTYLSLTVHGLLFLLTFCVFNVFVMTLCGRQTEAILYPIALNLLIPLVIWFGMHLGLMNIFGCGYYDIASYDSYSTMRVYWMGISVLAFFSPFGNILGTIMFGDEGVIVATLSLLFLAVMIPLGLLTYSKRHSERIGQSFVFKHVYAVTSVIVAFSAVVCFFWAAENYLRDENGGEGFFRLIPTAIPVLLAALLFLMVLMELVNYRKIKNFPKLLIRYAGVLAAGTLVSFTLYESDGFGESSYVPSADETVYMAASMVDWSTEIGVQETTMDVMVEADGALAETLRSAHRTLTEDRENGEKYEDLEGSKIIFSYYLKNGNIITRTYPTDIPEGLRTTIVESEEYRYSQLLVTDLTLRYDLTWSDITYAQHFRKTEKKEEPLAVQLTYPAVRYTDWFGSRQRHEIVIEGIDYQELRDALEADLRNDSDFGRHTGLPIAQIEVGKMEEMRGENSEKEEMFVSMFYTLHYQLYDDYTNTLSLLRKSAELPTSEEIREKIPSTYDYYTLARVPIVPKGQDIISNQSLAYSRMFGMIWDQNTDEALITGEQFTEALSHSAEYVYSDPERDYVYVISCGAPNRMEDTVPRTQLHKECFEFAILISEEFYNTLDQWYEQGYVSAPDETGSTSVAVEYGCHAR